MANYTLTHTGAQVDDAVEKVVNPYTNVSMSVVSSRLSNFTYTARYYPMIGKVFLRAYGQITATSADVDVGVIQAGSKYPPYRHALSVKCNSLVDASVSTDGLIAIRTHEAVPAGRDIYITGWWDA